MKALIAGFSVGTALSCFFVPPSYYDSGVLFVVGILVHITLENKRK